MKHAFKIGAKTIDVFDKNVRYIAVNIVTSALGFVRSIVFLRSLGLFDLGAVALVQTISLFFNMMQLGLLNGGYRILSAGKEDLEKDINNIIFSYTGMLFGVSSLVILVLHVNKLWALSGLTIGALALLANWLTNTLIAKRKLADLNTINLVSNLAAISVLPSIHYLGIYGAFLSLFLQPFIFICYCMIRFPELRPSQFTLNIKIIKWILSFGFIPFLVGVLSYVSIQGERWAIQRELGTDFLGKFYLPIVFCTLVVLIPNSLNNIFFPKVVKAFVEKQERTIGSLLRQYAIILAGYLLVVCLVVFSIFKMAVQVLFPQHAPMVSAVYAILPGQCALILSAPLVLYFNATVILRPLLVSNACGLAAIFGLLGYLIIAGRMSIFNVALIDSIGGISILVILGVLYLYHKRGVAGNATV